jgi:hypothetical protein
VSRADVQGIRALGSGSCKLRIPFDELSPGTLLPVAKRFLCSGLQKLPVLRLTKKVLQGDSQERRVNRAHLSLTFDVWGGLRLAERRPLDGGVRCNEWAPTVMALKKAQPALGAGAGTMDEQCCDGLHFDGDSALAPMQGHLPH